MLSCSITTIKLQSYCSVGFVIRQYKVSGSVIRNSYLLIKIGSRQIEFSFTDCWLFIYSNKAFDFNSRIAKVKKEK